MAAYKRIQQTTVKKEGGVFERPTEHVSYGKKVIRKGSVLKSGYCITKLELIVCLSLYLFFIIPGIIYTLYLLFR